MPSCVKGPSGRKPGGQPGHEGKGRLLLEAAAVDEVVDHWPAGYGCGRVFGPAGLVAVGVPARHQVEELPVMAVLVTEHRCQRVICPGCGAERRGELPAQVASSALGPRLQAAVVTLSVRNRISRRDVVELCEQLFQARISTLDPSASGGARSPKFVVASTTPRGFGRETLLRTTKGDLMHVQIATFGLNGITEDEYLQACQAETATFAAIPGLIAKTWLRDADTNTYGGVYLWCDREAYEAYVAGEVWAAVAGDASLSDVTSRDFAVFEDLTTATQPGLSLV